jgi:hypothetical protein
MLNQISCISVSDSVLVVLDYCVAGTLVFGCFDALCCLGVFEMSDSRVRCLA